jgi:hypothetical protein
MNEAAQQLPPDTDVVFVGAGHNALVGAAYLLEAGRSVCLLERMDQPGGWVRTAALDAPGSITTAGRRCILLSSAARCGRSWALTWHATGSSTSRRPWPPRHRGPTGARPSCPWIPVNSPQSWSDSARAPGTACSRQSPTPACGSEPKRRWRPRPNGHSTSGSTCSRRDVIVNHYRSTVAG